ncbi:MAG: hypothetical protein ACFB0E_20900 [Leptolyngbyaceae cyanobacterium]
MARSDFNMIPINHIFKENAPVITRHFPIEGTSPPVDDAYILLQIQGVAANHTLFINDQHIAGVALSPAPGSTQAWRLSFSHIPPGILRSGDNTIRINRNPHAGDDFHVAWVVVNWRENS